MELDPLYKALSLFRRRKFQECSNLCTEILQNNAFDQAAWSLKTRALTELVYVDDIEADEESIADCVMDENSIAQIARPGTSLRTPGTSHGGPTQVMRCLKNTFKKFNNL
uniref:Tetratricopeptide repeat protein 8 n=1 Tax=Strigamia maritima TaxID=126957 RepID=T1IGX0_STRMM